MKKSVGIVAAALLLAGCSSSAPASTPIVANPPAAASSTSASPSAAAVPTNARGHILAKVGDTLTLTSEGKETAKVTVTAIQPDFKCTGKYAPTAANGHFLAVSFDITVGSSAKYTVFPTLKVIAPDGTTENNTPSASYGCLDDSKILPMSINKGEHVTGSIVLDTANAHGGLVYSEPFLDGSWEFSY